MRRHRNHFARVRSTARGRQRGSVIVELSLIFMAVVCLVLGALDFGQFLFIHQMLTERARSALRYGVTTSPVDTTGVQNIVLYGQTTGAGMACSDSLLLWSR
jgi:hypothetical protein